MRTSWLLTTDQDIDLSHNTKIRMFSKQDADLLSEKIRKCNAFSRHSGENSFYLRRAVEFGDRTVIEVQLPGTPDDAYNEAEKIANNAEKIAILSTTLVTKKADLLRKLGISRNTRSEIDFIMDNQMYYIRSKSQRFPSSEGIQLDQVFQNRFRKSGFIELFSFCHGANDLAKRIQLSTDWLLESRRETRLEAAVVKTAIALESLLIFAESESLARSLSERMAFLLTSDPETRRLVSKIVKTFYDARSGIVHGSKDKAKKLSSELVEGVDRLTLLLHLVLAANTTNWTNIQTLQGWCEDQRWGSPDNSIKIPFNQTHLRNAIALATKPKVKS